MGSKKRLKNAVALVAGATRGAGRAIAVALGEQGATVYCTGRSTRGTPSPMKRPETIDVRRRGCRWPQARLGHVLPR